MIMQLIQKYLLMVILALMQVRIEAANVGGLRVVALGGEVMGTDIVLRWAPLVTFRVP